MSLRMALEKDNETLQVDISSDPVVELVAKPEGHLEELDPEEIVNLENSENVVASNTGQLAVETGAKGTRLGTNDSLTETTNEVANRSASLSESPLSGMTDKAENLEGMNGSVERATCQRPLQHDCDSLTEKRGKEQSQAESEASPVVNDVNIDHLSTCMANSDELQTSVITSSTTAFINDEPTESDITRSSERNIPNQIPASGLHDNVSVASLDTDLTPEKAKPLAGVCGSEVPPSSPRKEVLYSDISDSDGEPDQHAAVIVRSNSTVCCNKSNAVVQEENAASCAEQNSCRVKHTAAVPLHLSENELKACEESRNKQHGDPIETRYSETSECEKEQSPVCSEKTKALELPNQKALTTQIHRTCGSEELLPENDPHNFGGCRYSDISESEGPLCEGKRQFMSATSRAVSLDASEIIRARMNLCADKVSNSSTIDVESINPNPCTQAPPGEEQNVQSSYNCASNLPDTDGPEFHLQTNPMKDTSYSDISDNENENEKKHDRGSSAQSDGKIDETTDADCSKVNLQTHPIKETYSDISESEDEQKGSTTENDGRVNTGKFTLSLHQRRWSLSRESQYSDISDSDGEQSPPCKGSVDVGKVSRHGHRKVHHGKSQDTHRLSRDSESENILRECREHSDREGDSKVTNIMEVSSAIPGEELSPQKGGQLNNADKLSSPDTGVEYIVSDDVNARITADTRETQQDSPHQSPYSDISDCDKGLSPPKVNVDDVALSIDGPRMMPGLRATSPTNESAAILRESPFSDISDSDNERNKFSGGNIQQQDSAVNSAAKPDLGKTIDGDGDDTSDALCRMDNEEGLIIDKSTASVEPFITVSNNNAELPVSSAQEGRLTGPNVVGVTSCNEDSTEETILSEQNDRPNMSETTCLPECSSTSVNNIEPDSDEADDGGNIEQEDSVHNYAANPDMSKIADLGRHTVGEIDNGSSAVSHKDNEQGSEFDKSTASIEPSMTLSNSNVEPQASSAEKRWRSFPNEIGLTSCNKDPTEETMLSEQNNRPKVNETTCLLECSSTCVDKATPNSDDDDGDGGGRGNVQQQNSVEMTDCREHSDRAGDSNVTYDMEVSSAIPGEDLPPQKAGELNNADKLSSPDTGVEYIVSDDVNARITADTRETQQDSPHQSPYSDISDCDQGLSPHKVNVDDVALSIDGPRMMPGLRATSPANESAAILRESPFSDISDSDNERNKFSGGNIQQQDSTVGKTIDGDGDDTSDALRRMDNEEGLIIDKSTASVEPFVTVSNNNAELPVSSAQEGRLTGPNVVGVTSFNEDSTEETIVSEQNDRPNVSETTCLPECSSTSVNNIEPDSDEADDGGNIEQEDSVHNSAANPDMSKIADLGKHTVSEIDNGSSAVSHKDNEQGSKFDKSTASIEPSMTLSNSNVEPQASSAEKSWCTFPNEVGLTSCNKDPTEETMLSEQNNGPKVNETTCLLECSSTCVDKTTSNCADDDGDDGGNVQQQDSVENSESHKENEQGSILDKSTASIEPSVTDSNSNDELLVSSMEKRLSTGPDDVGLTSCNKDPAAETVVSEQNDGPQVNETTCLQESNDNDGIHSTNNATRVRGSYSVQPLDTSQASNAEKCVGGEDCNDHQSFASGVSTDKSSLSETVDGFSGETVSEEENFTEDCMEIVNHAAIINSEKSQPEREDIGEVMMTGESGKVPRLNSQGSIHIEDCSSSQNDLAENVATTTQNVDNDERPILQTDPSYLRTHVSPSTKETTTTVPSTVEICSEVGEAAASVGNSTISSDKAGNGVLMKSTETAQEVRLSVESDMDIESQAAQSVPEIPASQHQVGRPAGSNGKDNNCETNKEAANVPLAPEACNSSGVSSDTHLSTPYASSSPLDAILREVQALNASGGLPSERNISRNSINWDAGSDSPEPSSFSGNNGGSIRNHGDYMYKSARSGRKQCWETGAVSSEGNQEMDSSSPQTENEVQQTPGRVHEIRPIVVAPVNDTIPGETSNLQSSDNSQSIEHSVETTDARWLDNYIPPTPSRFGQPIVIAPTNSLESITSQSSDQGRTSTLPTGNVGREGSYDRHPTGSESNRSVQQAVVRDAVATTVEDDDCMITFAKVKAQSSTLEIERKHSVASKQVTSSAQVTTTTASVLVSLLSNNTPPATQMAPVSIAGHPSVSRRTASGFISGVIDKCLTPTCVASVTTRSEAPSSQPTRQSRPKKTTYIVSALGTRSSHNIERTQPPTNTLPTTPASQHSSYSKYIHFLMDVLHRQELTASVTSTALNNSSREKPASVTTQSSTATTITLQPIRTQASMRSTVQQPTSTSQAVSTEPVVSAAIPTPCTLPTQVSASTTLHKPSTTKSTLANSQKTFADLLKERLKTNPNIAQTLQAVRQSARFTSSTVHYIPHSTAPATLPSHQTLHSRPDSLSLPVTSSTLQTTSSVCRSTLTVNHTPQPYVSSYSSGSQILSTTQNLPIVSSGVRVGQLSVPPGSIPAQNALSNDIDSHSRVFPASTSKNSTTRGRLTVISTSSRVDTQRQYTGIPAYNTTKKTTEVTQSVMSPLIATHPIISGVTNGNPSRNHPGMQIPSHLPPVQTPTQANNPRAVFGVFNMRGAVPVAPPNVVAPRSNAIPRAPAVSSASHRVQSQYVNDARRDSISGNSQPVQQVIPQGPVVAPAPCVVESQQVQEVSRSHSVQQTGLQGSSSQISTNVVLNSGLGTSNSRDTSGIFRSGHGQQQRNDPLPASSSGESHSNCPRLNEQLSRPTAVSSSGTCVNPTEVYEASSLSVGQIAARLIQNPQKDTPQVYSFSVLKDLPSKATVNVSSAAENENDDVVFVGYEISKHLPWHILIDVCYKDSNQKKAQDAAIIGGCLACKCAPKMQEQELCSADKWAVNIRAQDSIKSEIILIVKRIANYARSNAFWKDTETFLRDGNTTAGWKGFCKPPFFINVAFPKCPRFESKTNAQAVRPEVTRSGVTVNEENMSRPVTSVASSALQAPCLAQGVSLDTQGIPCSTGALSTDSSTVTVPTVMSSGTPTSVSTLSTSSASSHPGRATPFAGNKKDNELLSPPSIHHLDGNGMPLSAKQGSLLVSSSPTTVGNQSWQSTRCVTMVCPSSTSKTTTPQPSTSRDERISGKCVQESINQAGSGAPTVVPSETSSSYKGKQPSQPDFNELMKQMMLVKEQGSVTAAQKDTLASVLSSYLEGIAADTHPERNIVQKQQTEPQPESSMTDLCPTNSEGTESHHGEVDTNLPQVNMTETSEPQRKTSFEQTPQRSTSKESRTNSSDVLTLSLSDVDDQTAGNITEETENLVEIIPDSPAADDSSAALTISSVTSLTRPSRQTSNKRNIFDNLLSGRPNQSSTSKSIQQSGSNNVEEKGSTSQVSTLADKHNLGMNSKLMMWYRMLSKGSEPVLSIERLTEEGIKRKISALKGKPDISNVPAKKKKIVSNPYDGLPDASDSRSESDCDRKNTSKRKDDMLGHDMHSASGRDTPPRKKRKWQSPDKYEGVGYSDVGGKKMARVHDSRKHKNISNLPTHTQSYQNVASGQTSKTSQRKSSEFDHHFSDHSRDSGVSIGECARTQTPEIPLTSDEELPVRELTFSDLSSNELWAVLEERQKLCFCACGLIFQDRPYYYLHRSTHSTNDPLSCSLCRLTLPDKHKFLTHFFEGHQ